MAVQHGKPAPHQVNRTPSPDVVSSIRSTSGQSGYGQSASPLGNSKVSLPPGVGGPQSLLGKNLRESVDDPAMDQVLKSGTAGRDDSIPADDGLQRRSVSDVSYPLAHGAVRQQNSDFLKSKKPS